MGVLRRIAAVLFGITALTQLSALDSPVAAQSPATTILRPGDAVQVTVFRDPEMSGEFTIAADGSIDHPLYQSVLIGGVPLEVAKERVGEFILEFKKDASFTLLKPLFRVAVGGEVARPDLYTFPPEITISQAVAAAGGVTEAGRLDAVRLLREGSEMRIDLTASGGEALGLTIQSGDQIIVSRSRGEFFRDYIAPAGSLVMAAVTLVSVLVR